MPKLVIASRNVKKTGEIAALLSPWNVEVVSVAEFPGVPDVVEDGDTFGENAAKKASQTAQQIGQWTLGEDSGLMVDALDGAPGIYSARYSGADATDQRNNHKLLAELQNVADEKRTARYICHVAIADPTGEIRLTVEASCRGRIVHAPRGENGFGYDPLFLVPELRRTFGELPAVVKRHLSHRARAFERLVPRLVRLLHAAE